MEALAEEGDWEGWVHLALETGDPKFWPHIRQSYQDEPKWRWMILFHLRIYWREYEAMVAPLFREALRDPEQCEMAVEAAEEFPSLSDDVVACLRDPNCLRRIRTTAQSATAQVTLCLQEHPDQAVATLRQALQDAWQSRDPDSAWPALYLAAAFPTLTDDVVFCLQDREFVRAVGIDPILGSLACLFGLTEGPPDQIHTEWGWQDPLLDGVRAEVKRRYGLDLDHLGPED